MKLNKVKVGFKGIVLLLLFINYGCSSNDDTPHLAEVKPPPLVEETTNQAPEAFTLKSVTNNAIDVDVRPTFSWNAAVDPDDENVTYELFMDESSDPTTSITSNINETNFTLEDRLLFAENYFWKVIASDSQGNTSSSNTFSFTTRNLKIPKTPLTTNADFVGRSSHTSVVFNDEMWVIGGYDGSSLFNDVWNSSDGVIWTQVADNALFTSRDNHTSVVFNNKIWVIGGNDGTSLLNDVWYSSDGITWIQVTNSALFSSRERHTSVVFDDKMWVIGGADGSSLLNDVWHSSDGVTWTQATDNAPFSKRIDLSSVVFDDKIWIIGGNDDVSVVRDVWHSSDGVTWAKVADTSRRSNHTSVVFDDKIWIIDGHDGIGGRVERDIEYSSDGVTWTRVTTDTEPQLISNHTSVVFDDKIWIIGGNTNGYLNDVWVLD